MEARWGQVLSFASPASLAPDSQDRGHRQKARPDPIFPFSPVISARLQQMERAEQSPEKRKELREIGKAVRALRFQFDPYNEGEVMTMVRKISQYAKAMQPAQLQARS